MKIRKNRQVQGIGIIRPFVRKFPAETKSGFIKGGEIIEDAFSEIFHREIIEKVFLPTPS